MNLRIKTKDGKTILPTLNFSYECKSCGHLNHIVRLNGLGKSFMELFNNEQYEMICNKCDDVENFEVEMEAK